jgi:serine protease Do
MKTIILSIVVFGLFANTSFAQKKQSQSEKKQEIIIRKNADPSKTIIEIDSNQITVNGKPLSDFDGDVTVLSRRFRGDGNRFFEPGNGFNFTFSNSAFLGVLVDKADQGVVVKKVIDTSSAQKAGLKENDIITKVGDETIASPEDLQKAIAKYKVGDHVTVNYLREGKKRSANVTLGKFTSGKLIDIRIDSLADSLGNRFRFNLPPMAREYFNFNRQPQLGLKIEDTRDNNGAKILEVKEGSPAEKAGLKKDDIITGIDGQKVNGVNDVRSKVIRSENKNDFQIKVKRGDKEINFDVQVPKVLKSIDI